MGVTRAKMAKAFHRNAAVTAKGRNPPFGIQKDDLKLFGHVGPIWNWPNPNFGPLITPPFTHLYPYKIESLNFTTNVLGNYSS